MFKKILVANDGFQHAFHALALGTKMARETGAELHMVSVQEIPYSPGTVEEVREEKAATGRQFGSVLKRARTLAAADDVKLQTRALAGRPIQDIVKLASDLKVDLLIVGASGNSTLYDRMIGGRADKIMHLATCPVLVVRPLRH
jgi:nucleotide-binding universal stress UspA family protein